jgi:hypothetical protein
VRLRGYRPAPRLRLGEAEVIPARGRDTAASPSTQKRSGSSIARLIPTRGPTATRRGRAVRANTAIRSPAVASVPSSSIVIPSARQSRPGPVAESPLGDDGVAARSSTASPFRVTRFAQTTWWIRNT